MARHWPAALVLAAVCACSAPSEPRPGPPVLPAASDLYLGAWTLSRSAEFAPGGPAHTRAVALAEEAAALAPDWVAPARFLDQWRHGPALTLPDRFAEHLRGAEAGDPGRAYLAGRLAPGAGGASTGEVQGAAGLPWTWHLVGWRARQRGDLTGAIEAERMAYRLARDPAEVTFFASILARFLEDADRPDLGVEVLQGALDPDATLAVRGAERVALEAQLATLWLLSERPEGLAAGTRLGLERLASAELTVAERRDLLKALGKVAAKGLVSGAELELALARASASCEGADREAVEELLATRLGAASGPGRDAGWRAALVRAFSADAGAAEPARTLGEWLDALPEEVREGVLGDGPVAALLDAVAELAREPGAVALQVEVGRRLVDAGWYEEGAGWSDRLQPADPAEARALRVAALRGRAALAALLNLGRRLDARRAYSSASGAAESIASAEALHDEVARVLEQSGLLPEAAAELESPVIDYGPAGTLVHPGPTFSEQDAELGRGDAGEPVPGLAAAFARMGRFALVGRGAGQGGPDATVLRRLHETRHEGAHLGRPFAGTVIWCQGADVPGRVGRGGGSIGGAALHEGFYVDLEVLAAERRFWVEVASRFRAPDGSVRAGDVGRALAVPGPSPARALSMQPALGAADRMRLAVMMQGEALVVPDLDRFCEGVAAHEEAHLCDRAAWYPLTTGRVLRVLGFAAGHGFSGARIARALELRAQLVAMCVLDDPRLLWVDLLDAAEGRLGRLSPHGEAYRELLGALLQRMDASPAAGGVPGTGARWIDRLHTVEPALLRAIATEEAAARGLVR